MKGYQVKKVDVARQIKAIESFEATAVKSAEETKGMVEKELKDLEATLQNIQGARPFEDLTVVCYGRTGRLSKERAGIVAARTENLTNDYRTRLWLLSQRSRSVLRRWSPTTGGCHPGTRYETRKDISRYMLTHITGEVRRPCSYLDGKSVSVLYCTS
jgi:hypothetical protein